MYGKRKRKHGRSTRKRIIRKTWLDKRGRAQQPMTSASWQDKTGSSKEWC